MTEENPRRESLPVGTTEAFIVYVLNNFPNRNRLTGYRLNQIAFLTDWIYAKAVADELSRLEKNGETLEKPQRPYIVADDWQVGHFGPHSRIFGGILSHLEELSSPRYAGVDAYLHEWQTQMVDKAIDKLNPLTSNEANQEIDKLYVVRCAGLFDRLDMLHYAVEYRRAKQTTKQMPTAELIESSDYVDIDLTSLTRDRRTLDTDS